MVEMADSERQAGAHGEVVVGVDGSDHALQALDWAAAAARRRGVVLRIVHVDRPPAPDVPGDAAVEAAADRASTVLGEDRVTTQVVDVIGRSPARTLLDHLDGASLLVVGGRGRGGFRDLLLGSTSQQVAAHSPLPVVVVPSTRDDPRDASEDVARSLVVGVDGSTGSGAALRWALDEARVAEVDLLAVHAYRSMTGAAPRDSVAGLSRSQVQAMRDRSHDVAIATVRDVIASARQERHADVEVRSEAEEGSPATVLSERAEQASSVLVVGRRGEGGGLAGTGLGSISQSCLRHAAAPVVVVPST